MQAARYPTNFEPGYEDFQQKISELMKHNSIKKQPIDVQELQHDLELIKQEIDDQGLRFHQNSIFTKYASKQDLAYKKKNASDCCFSCGEEIKKQVQCQLCAEIFCKNCCVRKRVIPYEQQKQFRLCCEICHSNYIRYFNHQQFYKETAIYLKAIEDLERKYEKVSTKYTKKEQQISTYKEESKAVKIKQGVYKKAIMDEEKKIKILNEQYQKIIRQKAQLLKVEEEKIRISKQQQEKKQQQEADLKLKKQQQQQQKRINQQKKQEQKQEKEQKKEQKNENEQKKSQVQVKQSEEDRLKRQKQLQERQAKLLEQKKLQQQQQKELQEKENYLKEQEIKRKQSDKQSVQSSTQSDKPVVQSKQKAGEKLLDQTQSQKEKINQNQTNKKQEQTKKSDLKIQEASLKQDQAKSVNSQAKVNSPATNRYTMKEIKSMDIKDLLSMKIPMNPGQQNNSRQKAIQRDLRRSVPAAGLSQSQKDQSEVSDNDRTHNFYQSVQESSIHDTPIGKLKSTRESRGQNESQKNDTSSVHSFKQEEDKDESQEQRRMTKQKLLRSSSLITTNKTVNKGSIAGGRADNQDEAGEPQKCSCEIM